MVELSPCPFCGARGDLDSTEPRDGQRTLHWVECRGDECGISGRICDTPEAAATFWNRRAPYGVALPSTLNDSGADRCICDQYPHTSECVTRGVPGTPPAAYDESYGTENRMQLPPGYEVVAEDVKPSTERGSWRCGACGFQGFWRGGPHCMATSTPGVATGYDGVTTHPEFGRNAGVEGRKP